MTIGIYEIRNTKTGKTYIGSSVNIEKRWKSHQSRMRNHHCENTHLNRDVIEYGIDSFTFEVLEELDTQDNQLIFDRERYWTEQAHNAKGGCYNQTYPAPRHGVGKRTNCTICGKRHYAKGFCFTHWLKTRKS